MQISRTSWHYRLFRYFVNIGRGPRFLNPFADGRGDPDLPSSLCPYAWSILLAGIGATILAVVFLAVAPFFLILWGVVRLVYVLRDVGDRVYDSLPRRRPAEAKSGRPPIERTTLRKPSLVVSYLRARKSRVCPKIELTD